MPELSKDELLHVKSPERESEVMAFAPSARELLHRAHEMRAAIVNDTAWDPSGLVALPRNVVADITCALEHRGCRGLGMAEGLCLPFLLYSTDTVHILRISDAMRGLHKLPAKCSSASVRQKLGVYAGVICALVESGALLRQHVTPERLLPVLSMQTESFLAGRQLIFRGLWLPPRFDVDELCRCRNITSWSLWARGALAVLNVYRGRVQNDCNVPVLLIALRSDMMRLALPTTALYFAASPDGKEAGVNGRSHECLPESFLRPVRNDAGVAQGEKEVVLPPFCLLTPAKSFGTIPLSRISSRETAQCAATEWQLDSVGERQIRRELRGAYEQASRGSKALRRRDWDRSVVLFIREVRGSWFEPGRDRLV